MAIRFDERVAIVTGAGGGLGRTYALALAARGARVVVNDYGGSVNGAGASSEPAERVAAEIRAAGGEAIANGADVTNLAQVRDMAAQAIATWGRIDILVNNAGILRDASFAKMTPESFKAVVDVHLLGSAYCTLAAWPHMRAANYGRIVMVSSTSGVYGNFGQSNYGAAKMGLVGFMNVLSIEGAKNNIGVSALIPTAATRMTEGVMSEKLRDLIDPAAVAPALLLLASEEAPRRAILSAGAGGYARTYVLETEGVWLKAGDRTPETLAARLAEISDKSTLHEYETAAGQAGKFLRKAAADAGISLTG
jgi:NAD(P)-dependent dehydrogenase (short-subunit alcohol dehydrogenase family)